MAEEAKAPVVFYCKDCEKLVDTHRVGKQYVYKCKICGTKNVAFGTEKSIKSFFRIKEEVVEEVVEEKKKEVPAEKAEDKKEDVKKEEAPAEEKVEEKKEEAGEKKEAEEKEEVSEKKK